MSLLLGQLERSSGCSAEPSTIINWDTVRLEPQERDKTKLLNDIMARYIKINVEDLILVGCIVCSSFLFDWGQLFSKLAY